MFAAIFFRPFLISYIVCWGVGTVLRVQSFFNSDEPVYALIVANAILTPGEGFFMALFFLVITIGKVDLILHERMEKKEEERKRKKELKRKAKGEGGEGGKVGGSIQNGDSEEIQSEEVQGSSKSVALINETEGLDSYEVKVEEDDQEEEEEEMEERKGRKGGGGEEESETVASDTSQSPSSSHSRSERGSSDSSSSI